MENRIDKSALPLCDQVAGYYVSWSRGCNYTLSLDRPCKRVEGSTIDRYHFTTDTTCDAVYPRLRRHLVPIVCTCAWKTRYADLICLVSFHAFMYPRLLAQRL